MTVSRKKQCIRQWLLLLQGMAMFSRLEVFPELLWEPFPASVFPRMEKVCLSRLHFRRLQAETEDIKKDDSGDGKTSDSTDNGTNSTSETNGNSTQSGNDQSGNGAGTSANNISGSSSGASQTEDTQETDSSASTSGTELSTSEYSTDVALFTISPDDTMTLEVSVDELDINSVEIGQEAAVTFDAIEDKEFTGEVTEIGNTASVNGGVAKYTVSVSVPKDEEMKQGMNASATIT